jgi:hypothetical protein
VQSGLSDSGAGVTRSFFVRATTWAKNVRTHRRNRFNNHPLLLFLTTLLHTVSEDENRSIQPRVIPDHNSSARRSLSHISDRVIRSPGPCSFADTLHQPQITPFNRSFSLQTQHITTV